MITVHNPQRKHTITKWTARLTFAICCTAFIVEPIVYDKAFACLIIAPSLTIGVYALVSALIKVK